MNIGICGKAVSLAFFVCLSFDEVFAAGFHVWIDESGHKQVSTIPRHGFNQQGNLRRLYDPNSLASQYHEMRTTLALQAAEIARAQAQQQRLENQPQLALPNAAVRAPKEGIMGLRHLIQLERRGGRYSEK